MIDIDWFLLQQDLPGTIRKVAKFLDKGLTEEQVAKLTEYLSIENFRHNKSVNMHELKEVNICSAREEAFVRNGKTVINGWQKEYTPEVVERVERWIAENLKKTDVRFPHVEGC